MRRVDGLSVGWTDTSIGVLVRSGTSLLLPFEYILVTSIDSGTDMREMPTAVGIAQRHSECKFLGSGLVIPAAIVVEVADVFKLFTGFDEIWCFEHDPMVAKPEALSLVGPLNLSTDDVPPSLRIWMAESSCKLGLGDGIGLNFATPDEGIGRAVEKLVIMSE